MEKHSLPLRGTAVRVLMIAPAPFDFDRGKSIRIRQTVSHLRELGHDVHVLTYPSGRPVTDGNTTVERAPSLFAQKEPSLPGVTFRQVLSNASILRRTWSHLRTGYFDVVHAHDVDGALIGQFARLLSRRSVPLVYDMHGTFRELDNHYDVVSSDRLASHIQQYLYDAADHLVVNWPHIMERLETTTPATLIMDQPDEVVCEVIEQFNAGERTRESPERWESEPYILYTGNYASYQGIDLLFEAFRQLDHDGSVRLVMTGDPSEQYIVNDDAIHYTGFVDEERLGELLAHADVLVSPRQTDGFPPMKMLYYLRTTGHIVATDRTCHTSVLDGVAGVTFVDGGPNEFAVGLEAALGDETAYDRQPIPEDIGRKYEAVYEQVNH